MSFICGCERHTVHTHDTRRLLCVLISCQLRSAAIGKVQGQTERGTSKGFTQAFQPRSCGGLQVSLIHPCHTHFVVLSIYRSAFCAGRGNCISAAHFKEILKTAVTTAMQDFLQVTKVGQIQNTLAIIDYVFISGSRYREIHDAHP